LFKHSLGTATLTKKATNMRVCEASAAEAGVVGSMREGVLELKILLTGQDGSKNNYVIMKNRTGTGGWTTPRHRHNFDQLRFILKGTYPYAKGKVMPEGSVGYFPESVHYGPQDRPEGLEMVTFQFGGASGQGFLSVSDREAANDVLQKKGQFKNGVFTYYDEHGKRHNQDGSEACFEEATGQKLTFSKPRYNDLVLMDPDSYEWVPSDIPGVSTKLLGAFTERKCQVSFTRIEAGATLPVGEQPSIELMFLSKGLVSVNGLEYEPHSAFEFSAKEGPINIRAVEESEFLSLILPQF
jgi:hypothetical protein